MNISEITKYYQKNQQFYTNLKQKINNNISGRICHHGIVVLNIIVYLLDIKNYLEIGVHNGGSMSYVVNQNKNAINCYGIDLFQDTPNQYKRDRLSQIRTFNNIQRNNISNSTIQLIQGNSISKDIINQVNNLEYDLLFIDGDHSYGMVKSDFENYSKLVKKNGIIVFDDYSKKWKEVIKFVDTIGITEGFKRIGLLFNNEMIYQKL
jgi:predicted O-methyltransferase YrrM